MRTLRGGGGCLPRISPPSLSLRLSPRTHIDFSPGIYKRVSASQKGTPLVSSVSFSFHLEFGYIVVIVGVPDGQTTCSRESALRFGVRTG